MLSLLSEIVYNVLKKARKCWCKAEWRCMYLCMPGCYGNREFRTIHVFYCRYVQCGIAYCRKYQFLGDLFVQITWNHEWFRYYRFRSLALPWLRKPWFWLRFNWLRFLGYPSEIVQWCQKSSCAKFRTFVQPVTVSLDWAIIRHTIMLDSMKRVPQNILSIAQMVWFILKSMAYVMWINWWLGIVISWWNLDHFVPVLFLKTYSLRMIHVLFVMKSSETQERVSIYAVE